MNRTDRAGTVAHRGGNTFHRLRPDVPGGEDSRAGRFERQWLEADIAEIAVSEYEPLGIEVNETIEPTCGRRSTDEGEQANAGLTRRSARPVVRDRDFLEMGVTVEFGHLGVRRQADLRRRVDPVDEVGRHRRAEVRAANRKGHICPFLGEEHCGLPGGVAAADHGDGERSAYSRFQVCRGVVDPGAFELPQSGNRQPPILDTW